MRIIEKRMVAVATSAVTLGSSTRKAHCIFIVQDTDTHHSGEHMLHFRESVAGTIRSRRDIIRRTLSCTGSACYSLEIPDKFWESFSDAREL